jgi:hypothetical protein
MGMKFCVFHHIIAISTLSNLLAWFQAEGYYDSNIDQDGFGIEAVTNMWEESL